ncbi:Uncharacterised protein [uncultured archaeon]|nr:Uncharacterised protein [uncultured archaeon]
MGWKNLGKVDLATNYCIISVNNTLFGVFCYRGDSKTPLGTAYRASRDKEWTGEITCGTRITFYKDKYADICEIFNENDIFLSNAEVTVNILQSESNKEELEKNRHLPQIVSLLKGEINSKDKDVPQI